MAVFDLVFRWRQERFERCASPTGYGYPVAAKPRMCLETTRAIFGDAEKEFGTVTIAAKPAMGGHNP